MCACVHAYVHPSVCMCACLYVCVCMRTYVCVSTCECVACIYILVYSVYINVQCTLYLTKYTWIFGICVYVCFCLCIYVALCICWCIYSLYDYLSTSLLNHVCVCVCGCVFVCIIPGSFLVLINLVALLMKIIWLVIIIKILSVIW